MNQRQAPKTIAERKAPEITRPVSQNGSSKSYNVVLPQGRIRPINPDEIDQALNLLMSDGYSESQKLQEKVVFFKRLSMREGYDLKRQIVALCFNKLVYSSLFVPQPGGAAFVFIAGMSRLDAVMDPKMEELAIHAIKKSRQWAIDDGANLLQVLLNPIDTLRQHLCLESGYKYLTDLVYLFCPVDNDQDSYDLPDEYHWLTYDSQNHELFKKVLSQTYQDSLDCPELEELRDIEQNHSRP